VKARLKPGETLGDRIMKVDHAGEHGAICEVVAASTEAVIWLGMRL